MQFQRKNLPASVDDLNTKQADFVTTYIEMGGKKGCEVEAALKAGYGNGVRTKASRQASKLLRNPNVVAAIQAELSNQFGAAAVRAVNVLIELADSGPPNVRLQAAKELIDRGYGPVVSRNAHIHVETFEDLLEDAMLLDSEAIAVECEEVDSKTLRIQKEDIDEDDDAPD